MPGDVKASPQLGKALQLEPYPGPPAFSAAVVGGKWWEARKYSRQSWSRVNQHRDGGSRWAPSLKTHSGPLG